MGGANGAHGVLAKHVDEQVAVCKDLYGVGGVHCNVDCLLRIIYDKCIMYIVILEIGSNYSNGIRQISCS